MVPANRLQALLDLSLALSSSLELREVLRELRTHAPALTGAGEVQLCVYDRGRDTLVTLTEEADDVEESSRAARRALETQQPTQVREQRNGRSFLLLPLVVRGETIGLLKLNDTKDRIWDEADVEFCRALADAAAAAVRNAMVYGEMQELAAQDKLTGLYNRRLFDDLLDAAVARSLRHGEPLALLAVDLDGLKRINDLGGHPAGDEALRTLARALAGSIRAGDFACRLGGDEFAVILPGSAPGDAIKVAERAQQALVRLGRGRYSFSGGIAQVTATQPSAHDVYRAADLASYRAKAAGGARTLLA
jgi:diguanylate cyclase (GGDEF)-like protein